MVSDQFAWGAILIIAVAVFATRYAGFALMQRMPLTPRVALFLEKMSVSVLVAIVASSCATGGLRTGAAVALGIAAMIVTRSAILAMLVGIAAGAAWTGLLP